MCWRGRQEWGQIETEERKGGAAKNESESETQRDMQDIMMITQWGKKNTGSDRDRTGEPQTEKVEVLCVRVCVCVYRERYKCGKFVYGWLAGSGEDSMSSAWA